jgi:hypothetical protein
MTTKEESSIGSRIIQAFKAKDLKEVAQIIGENYSSLHNWTAKRRDFPTNVLIKIANMANVSIDWVLTGENVREKDSSDGRNFETIIEEKIREIVREEISNGTALHEKVQGLILAMQPNVREQNAFAEADFDKTGKEDKAA